MNHRIMSAVCAGVLALCLGARSYGQASVLVVDSSGNLGIGTSTPMSGISAGGLAITNPNSNAAGIDLKNSGTGGHEWLIESTGPTHGLGVGKFLIYDCSQIGSQPRLAIDTAGNVGVGVAAPAYKLDVSGQVRATSFVATSGNTYADFVFKRGYRLMPLSEVETSIKTHGHLPDVPSEAEVKANGIDLQKMEVVLLQKVEELTLHAIAQEKRIEELEKENRRLTAIR